jgi:L-alanine-DL-glutamate epimerase-like enolase superfamily enzyme
MGRSGGTVILARIEWAPFRIPFRVPYVTARGTATYRSGFILRLTADDGVQGLGEASLDPAAPEGEVNAGGPLIESLARALAGLDDQAAQPILEPYLAGDELAHAIHCAFETAILDIAARQVHLPLAALLTGHAEDPPVLEPARRAVTVNATIATKTTEEAAAAALVALASGFSCIKLKAGMEASVEAEVQRVRTIREIMGPATKLRLDANGAWDETTAVSTLRALEPYDIELIEQPVPAGDIEALGRIRDAVMMPVAADESASDEESALAALEHADAIVLKAMRLGGPTVVRSLCQIAEVAGRGVVVTTTIDTGVATAMALQVAAAMPDDGIAHGLATAALLESDLLTAPLRLERGTMHLPAGPGLGVELDAHDAAKYLGGWQEVRA